MQKDYILSDAELSHISLFTGAGGLDIGLERSGFINKLCIENNINCVATIKQNRPDWKISNPLDIHLISSQQILRQAGLKKRKIGLLSGGPPCQPYSKASYWHNGDSKRLKDHRADTLKHFLRVIGETLPQVILFENVKGFAYKNKDEGYKYFLRSLQRINRENRVNYKANTYVLNCADYGVPQLRERIFIIAHVEGLHFNEPKPTHSEIINSKSIEPYITTWDAIGDLDVDISTEHLNPTGKWADLLQSIPEGNNYQWHTPRGGGVPLFGYRTRYWNFLLKLSKAQPSWTIPAQPGPASGPFHWKNRKLSIREMCRLQTIPDDWIITGDYREANQQVGNAIPSLIGEILGREIQKQFYNKTFRKKLTLQTPRQIETPRRYKTKPIPKKYLTRNSDVTEHPGEGLGPGALKKEMTDAKYR